uniref:hypothetical protein n=1 Tax=Thaumasiovibrio subtropicus TaxID=1891207 RepID=UPI00192CFB72
MKALYIGLPAVGHVTPATSLVKALTERGHDVTFYCSHHFEEKIADTGATFSCYPELSDEHKGIAYGLLSLGNSLLDIAVQQMPFLVSEVKRLKPDYILYDSVAPWGRCLAKVTGLPAVNVVTTPVVNRAILMSRKRWGIPLTYLLKLFEFKFDIRKKLTILNEEFNYHAGFSDLFSNCAEIN